MRVNLFETSVEGHRARYLRETIVGLKYHNNDRDVRLCTFEENRDRPEQCDYLKPNEELSRFRPLPYLRMIASIRSEFTRLSLLRSDRREVHRRGRIRGSLFLGRSNRPTLSVSFRGGPRLYLLSVIHRKSTLCDQRAWMGWAVDRYQHGKAIDCRDSRRIQQELSSWLSGGEIRTASHQTAEQLRSECTSERFGSMWASL